MGLLDAINPFSVVSSVLESLGLPPPIANAAKVAFGAITANPVVAIEGGMGLVGNILEGGAKTEYQPSSPSSAGKGWARSDDSPGAGLVTSALAMTLGEVGRSAMDLVLSFFTQAPPASKVRYSADSPLDNDILQYRDALETLSANFRTFDAAGDSADGLISLDGLKAIAKNPRASQKLKAAAKFLVDHPEYFNRLESSRAFLGLRDGKISLGDIQNELSGVNADIQRYGVPLKHLSAPKPKGIKSAEPSSESKSSSSSSSSSSIQKILKNPKLSTEEKVRMLLEHILKDIDKDVESTMNDLSQAQDEKTTTGTAKDVDALTRKLQMLMERRRQMTELVSTMSRNFNDMAMASIRNMRS